MFVKIRNAIKGKNPGARETGWLKNFVSRIGMDIFLVFNAAGRQQYFPGPSFASLDVFRASKFPCANL